MQKIGQLYLPDGDTFFALKGEYELRDYNLAKSYFKTRRLAVDVGAHVGYWSKRLVNDFDIVYAFEPVNEHVECLRNNVPNHNLVINQIALSDRDCEVSFNKYIENSGMSRISQDGMELRANTLDSYLLPCLDFIKIDVEGHELNVLKGAKQTIERYRPIVFMEILHQSDAETRQAIFDFLAPLNYNMTDVIDENYIFIHVNP